MYQWWMAQEQVELWKEANRPLTETERQRAELLREMAAQKPSLLERIADLFRARVEMPEPYIARTQAEAELISMGIIGRETRRAA